MKKKLLCVAMGAMLAAGAANAVQTHSSMNMLGDLLLPPAYFIGGVPAVANVSIYDWDVNEDRLDFSVYLEPGGVWVQSLRSQQAAELKPIVTLRKR